MRIIAGKFKGRKLDSPMGLAVRPTADRIKETMFNILSSRYPFEGGEVLDLFCGSGALGMEAYSRGANSVIFADSALSSINLTKHNLKKCGMDNLLSNVFLAEYRLALKKLNGRRFDLILLDPPYNAGYESELISLIQKYELLKASGVIVLEHSILLDVSIYEQYEIHTRACGNTALSFFKVKE